MNIDNPWVGIFIRWLTQNNLRHKLPPYFFEHLDKVASYRALASPCGSMISSQWGRFTKPYLETRYHMFIHRVFMPILRSCGYLTKNNKPILLGILNETWRDYLSVAERYERLKSELQSAMNKHIDPHITYTLDLQFQRLLFYDHPLTMEELNSRYVKRTKIKKSG
jgi:hypothetical protein